MSAGDFVDLSGYTTDALLDALCSLTHKLHALRHRAAEGGGVHATIDSVQAQRDLVRAEVLRRTADYDTRQRAGL